MDKTKVLLASVLTLSTALNTMPVNVYAQIDELPEENVVEETEITTSEEIGETVTQEDANIPLKEDSEGENTEGMPEEKVVPVADGVAMIGDTQYATLQEAIESAKDGETIQLSKNVTENLVLNKNVVLDGVNKFTITTQGSSTISNGVVQNLTLKPENGKSKIYFGGKESTKTRLENVSIQYDVTTREYYTYTAAGNSALVDFINVSFVNSPNNQGVEIVAPEWSYGLFVQSQKDTGSINLTNCKFEGAFRTMISSASGGMNVKNCSFINSVYSVLNGPTTGAQEEATCVTTSTSTNNHLVFTNNTFNNAGAIYVQTQIDFRKNHIIADGLMHYIQAKGSIGETIDFSDNTFDTGNNNYVVIDVPSTKIKMPVGMRVIDYWVWYDTPVNVRPDDYSDYLYMYNEDGSITYVPQSDIALEQFVRQNNGNKQVTNQDTVLIEKELNLNNLEIAEDNLLNIIIAETGNLNLAGDMNVKGTLDVKGSGKLTITKDSKLTLDKTGVFDIDNSMKMENNGTIQNDGTLTLPDALSGTGEVVGDGQINTYPQIQADDVILTVNDEFNPLDYVTASDKEDGKIEKIEILENTVDTTKTGKYIVTYKVTDSKNAIVTKTINVIVNPKMETINHLPVIHAKDITLTVGDKFNALKGVTASDEEDQDLTKCIKVVLNKVDTKKAGAYLVTYEVSDSQGATTTKTITVTVKDKVVEEDKKEETNKDKGTNTGLGLGTGLFTSLAISAVSGLGILEVLKRRNRK